MGSLIYCLQITWRSGTAISLKGKVHHVFDSYGYFLNSFFNQYERPGSFNVLLVTLARNILSRIVLMLTNGT